ncbi:MAG: hypothetical protein KJO02_03625, partial [Erythrobacter sp.]|nr:hypothetical protein [Erythrobacter sp.]
MRASLFLISLALSSAGCSGNEEDNASDPPAAEAPPVPPTPPEPDPEAVSFDDDEARSGGTREFAYSWPAAVNALPTLALQLERERDQALARQKKGWEQSLVDFPGDCVTCKA